MFEEPKVKQLAVFGRSGATGRALIRNALIKGINIRTLVRNPDVLGNRLKGAEIIKGSLANPGDISACLGVSDAVICVFGPRPTYTDIFCEEATRQIIIAMKEHNIQHLLCQTGGM